MATPLNAPRKILILKPSSLGDVVQALPVLRILKKRLQTSLFYWWIDSRLAPLLEGDPDLEGLVLFERRRWARPSGWMDMTRSLAWVRAQRFDWVIDLQCLARSGAFAWFANGSHLVGLDEPREGARGFYDRVARRSSYHTHAVDWYLSVLPLLGIPAEHPLTLDWVPVRPKTAESVARKLGPGRFDWVLIQPGARWQNKRWPLENFIELARLLRLSKPLVRLAVLGGNEDQELGTAFERALGKDCLNLTGKLSLREMVECIRMSKLMITNDTGPMHVAAALKKPVVALFGPTEPRRTGPYGQLENVLQIDLPCVPCLSSRCRNSIPLECLHRVNVAEALQAVCLKL